MAETIYLLCALTSVICAALLIRSWIRSHARLLLWSSLCFVGLAVNNVLLFVDLVIFRDLDLASVRSIEALLSISILAIAMVWERSSRVPLRRCAPLDPRSALLGDRARPRASWRGGLTPAATH